MAAQHLENPWKTRPTRRIRAKTSGYPLRRAADQGGPLSGTVFAVRVQSSLTRSPVSRKVRLLGESRREHRVTDSGPEAGAPGGRGSELPLQPRYRQAKRTKRGGTGDGES